MHLSNRTSRRPISSRAGMVTRFAAVAAALPLLATLVAAPAAAQTPWPRCTGNGPSGTLHAHKIVGQLRAEDGLFEGPVWTNGALYFSDFSFSRGNPSRIWRMTPDGQTTLAFDDSGSNGIALERDGNLVTANHAASGLVRISPLTGQRSVIVNQYNGIGFNSPNDVAIANDGTMYFTDPMFQHNPDLPAQPTMNVYRRATDGTVTVIDSTLTNPNGVSLSPRGDVLYVAGNGNLIRAWTIVNGVPQNPRTFTDQVINPDGMTVDCFGNLYVTEHDQKKVTVWNPAGKNIATIHTDANVTNVAFGGHDQRTLFITGMHAVWKIQMSAPGSVY